MFHTIIHTFSLLAVEKELAQNIFLDKIATTSGLSPSLVHNTVKWFRDSWKSQCINASSINHFTPSFSTPRNAIHITAVQNHPLELLSDDGCISGHSPRYLHVCEGTIDTEVILAFCRDMLLSTQWLLLGRQSQGNITLAKQLATFNVFCSKTCKTCNEVMQHSAKHVFVTTQGPVTLARISS